MQQTSTFNYLDLPDMVKALSLSEISEITAVINHERSLYSKEQYTSVIIASRIIALKKLR
jgi:hypothetical protein